MIIDSSVGIPRITSPRQSFRPFRCDCKNKSIAWPRTARQPENGSERCSIIPRNLTAANESVRRHVRSDDYARAHVPASQTGSGIRSISKGWGRRITIPPPVLGSRWNERGRPT